MNNTMQVHRIYKYSPINKNAISSLVFEKNWISDPYNFNDPFELVLPPDFDFMTNAYITEEEKKNKDMIKSYNNNIGVICYSNEPDNMLLWSHYGDNHAGICLGFEPTIEYNYNNKDFKFNNLNFVKYSNIIPKPNFKDLDINDIKDVFCTKSKTWEYEHEIRQVFNKKLEYTEYPGKLKEIYFGCNTSENDIKLIETLLKNKGIQFWYCEKQEGCFNLQPIGGNYKKYK